MSNEIEKPNKNDLRSLLASDKFKDQIALALPRHCTPDRFARIALSALNRTPKLLECTQQSILKCLMDLSAFGLEPDGRNAHLIPYGKECQLIVDWKGLVALAKRNGDVKAWQAFDVCENDDFSWEDGIVSHKINYREDRGAAQCYYSKVTLSDGTASFEVMTKAEVDAIRKISKSGSSGPWVQSYGEMAKKTVIRRHSKQLDLSPQVKEALATENHEYDDKPIRNVTPANTGIMDPFAAPPPPEALEEVAGKPIIDADDPSTYQD